MAEPHDPLTPGERRILAEARARDEEPYIVYGSEIVSTWPTPVDVLKWSAVVFAVCLEILIVIAVVLTMFGIY